MKHFGFVLALTVLAPLRITLGQTPQPYQDPFSPPVGNSLSTDNRGGLPGGPEVLGIYDPSVKPLDATDRSALDLGRTGCVNQASGDTSCSRSSPSVPKATVLRAEQTKSASSWVAGRPAFQSTLRVGVGNAPIQHHGVLEIPVVPATKTTRSIPKERISNEANPPRTEAPEQIQRDDLKYQRIDTSTVNHAALKSVGHPRRECTRRRPSECERASCNESGFVVTPAECSR